MRRLDDTPLDPEIEASLDAIDATLAGEPVDPRFAELAELALMLADERPAPSEKFVRELDTRVQWRFATQPSPRGLSSAPARRLRWSWGAVGGGALATALTGALVALVVVLGPSGGGGSSSSSTSGPFFSTSSTSTSASAPATTPSASGATAGAASHGTVYGQQSLNALRNSPSTNDSAKRLGSPTIFAPAETLTPASRTPAPAANGRMIVQSAELDLAAAPNHVDAVAQEVFNVIGQVGGIVDSSSVTQTGGADGQAYFKLRIPSGVLSQTLARLSQLPGAQVLTRTDNTQDVNSQWVSVNRKVADDKALRAALLKQLANATTTGQIDSLNARIHDVEAAIAADEASVRALSAQINYSQVVVSINARPTPPPVKHHHSSGGLTLGHSAHIAGRVLVVAAGIALIVLAGLVPVGLLAALGAWIAVTVRRRRREQALDLA